MTVAELRRVFLRVWLVDFEFYQPDGERPMPLCVVAKEFFTGRCIKGWITDFSQTPYGVGPDDLFVSYYASAELGCHTAMNWRMPDHILDLCAEFRCRTAGLETPNGRNLLGALSWFGLPGLESAVKNEMRDLAKRGPPYTAAEQRDLVAYCETDVTALEKLLPAMLSRIDLPRALIRGEYMARLAEVEWNGVPINVERYELLRDRWDEIKLALIQRIDESYGVYEGLTFKRDKFRSWLVANRIPWPLLESGDLALDDDTFKDLAKLYPVLLPLKELRVSLGRLRLNELTIGRDGRNRCLLSAFAAKTSRNQPSNSKFVFGPAVWLRSLIEAPPGSAIAYVDWEQQEFGIAAYLSGDQAMLDAYRSGDPYLAFAKQAKAVPPNATKQTHKAERERFKTCALGVQYGMGEQTLAYRLGLDDIYGRELLNLHRLTYPIFWRWSEAVKNHGMLHGSLHTTYGWWLHTDHNTKPNTLKNFPVQGNGAEMLRLAIIMAGHASVKVCAPVHDALLIEAPTDEIEDAVKRCQKCMATASELVMPGFPLRTDAKIFRAPEHYRDERGEQFWNEIWPLAIDASKGVPLRTPTMCANTHPPVHSCTPDPLILS